jgi:site-specific DNA recombinase
VGRIAHHGASYAGQHSGIVTQGVWDRVQILLTQNRQGSRTAGSSAPCLLSGLLFDDRGNVMSPSHARKANGRRYRYYVSQAVLQGRQEGAGSIRRVSAEAIESLVERTLCKSLPKAKQTEWPLLSIEKKREHLKRLIKKITMRAGEVEVGLTDVGRDQFVDVAPSGSMRIATVMKASLGGRQIVPSDGPSARVDRSLVKAIAWARDLRHRLERDGKSLDELARENGCSRPYVSSMIRLAYLAPGITQSILDGTQPAQLTLADLMQREIPGDWSEQRIAFGFL